VKTDEEVTLSIQLKYMNKSVAYFHLLNN